MDETALPSGDFGPVDFCALRRLASIWRLLAMGYSPTFRVSMAIYAVRGMKILNH
jgi:hypothetical protein